MLREMTQDDYTTLVEIMQDEQTMHSYEGAFSDNETQDWLNKRISHYQEYGFGLWAVVLKERNRMIGQSGITWQDIGGERILEIGYLFNRAYWHMGYATEAAAACKEYAFNKLGAKEISSIIRDTNIASLNVAIRNGMLVRKRVIKHYRGVDMPHYILSVKA